MSKLYKTARGKAVDIEGLRLANEESIAVGNMKVNARGDKIGPMGTVLETRNQIQDSYYKLSTPIPQDVVIPNVDPATTRQIMQQQAKSGASVTQGQPVPEAIADVPGADEFEPTTDPVDPLPEVPPPAAEPPMRGSLANSVAAPKTVKQGPVPPLNSKKSGPGRI
jgi:hypothetical protein